LRLIGRTTAGATGQTSAGRSSVGRSSVGLLGSDAEESSMSTTRFAHPRVGAFAVAIAVALLVTACGGSGGATGPPSGAPRLGASADAFVPTPVPNTVPTPLAGGDGGLVVTAANIAFEPTELAAPADTPFRLQLNNKDGGVPHNVTILASDGSELFTGEIFVGPGAKAYDLPALPAGSYRFMCKVHPNMTGTLHVGG
jgi:plastocyanin